MSGDQPDRVTALIHGALLSCARDKPDDGLRAVVGAALTVRDLHEEQRAGLILAAVLADSTWSGAGGTEPGQQLAARLVGATRELGTEYAEVTWSGWTPEQRWEALGWLFTVSALGAGLPRSYSVTLAAACLLPE